LSRKARKPSKTALFEAAKAWDAARVMTIVAEAPVLIDATDPKGRMALHLACGVRPGGKGLGEPSGIHTPRCCGGRRAPEAVVPMEEDESFRATPVVRGCARREPAAGALSLKHGADASYRVGAGETTPCHAELLKCRPRLDLGRTARRRSSMLHGYA
jgi:hypothetical protein